MIDLDLPEADITDVHDTLFGATDYLRRIHWWVRLFGIMWVVIPCVVAVIAVGAFLGVLSGSS